MACFDKNYWLIALSSWAGVVVCIEPQETVTEIYLEASNLLPHEKQGSGNM